MAGINLNKKLWRIPQQGISTRCLRRDCQLF